MKVAATNPTEITELIRFLNELKSFQNEFKYTDYSSLKLDENEYPIISKSKAYCDEMGIDSVRELMFNVLENLNNIHYLRILWNADTLFKNCADLTSDTLEFNKELCDNAEKAEKYDALYKKVIDNYVDSDNNYIDEDKVDLKAIAVSVASSFGIQKLKSKD